MTLANNYEIFSSNDEEFRDKILSFPSNDEGDLKLLMIEIEKFDKDILWLKWFEILDTLSEIRRAWWVRPEVWIPNHLAETVLHHSLNLETACECAVEWLKLSTEIIIQAPKNFSRMWKVHDFPEYHRVLPDITPHCSYTQEQKRILERYAVLVLKEILQKWWEEDIRLLEEYIAQESHDAKLLYLFDKIDAWNQAFKYESMWFKKNVAHFHPYNLEKLKDNSYLTMIYEILLEREFWEREDRNWNRNTKILDPHMQYFELLRLWWNVNEWKYRMNSILKWKYIN